MSRTHVVYTPQELLHILHAATASRDLLDVEKYSTLQPFYKNTAQIASGMMDKPVDAPRIKRKIEDQLRKAAVRFPPLLCMERLIFKDGCTESKEWRRAY